jgi:hypothetical protein
MKGISTIYTSAIKKHLAPLFANWEPDQPVKLGDYGLIRARKFIPVGNIADLGIIFETTTERTNSNKSFSSDQKMEIKFNGKGEIAGNAKASLDIKFHTKNAVFFNASGCDFMTMKNKDTVGKQIEDKYNSGDWNKEHAVVTDLVMSKTTLVVVSSAKDAEITLVAKSPTLKTIELTNAGLNLQATRKSQIGYLIETKKNLTPLFVLWELTTFTSEFEPIYRNGVDNYGIDGDKSEILRFSKIP